MPMMMFAVMLATMPVVQDSGNQSDPVASAAPVAPQLSLDTPVQDLVADPRAKPVVDKHFKEMLAHPMYEQFKHMSLRQLQPLARGELTNDMLAAIEKDLAALR